MKTKLYTLLAVLLVSLGLVACGAAPAEPAAPEAPESNNVENVEVEAGTPPQIMVMNPRARATIPNGAVYMTLMNEGGSADALLGGATEVAETVEIHESIMEGDMMRMRPVEKIEVPAGGSATLEPGGLHVMLIGVNQDLAPDDTFELTLTFEQSGEQTVEVTVGDMSGMSMDMDMEDGESE